MLEGYGLSETSPLATFNHFEKPSKPGTVGQPIFGVDVRCFDEDDNEVERGTRGEVVIRGANVMKGYYKRPEATAEAFRSGWFHTGDIGIMDEDGYLSIVDRKKDMILRGGYNVYPRELGRNNYDASGCFARRRSRRSGRASGRRSQSVYRPENGRGNNRSGNDRVVQNAVCRE